MTDKMEKRIEKTYFKGWKDGAKSLLTGLGVTWKEYFTKKVTEQYPENRKTTLHVSARHKGRLVMPVDENGNNKCIACGLCQRSCPNGTITVLTEMVEQEDGKKTKVLKDYRYDLGDCMFCELCVNACPKGAIKFVNDFENSVFERDSLVFHLNTEKYHHSLPNIENGGPEIKIGEFNTDK